MALDMSKVKVPGFGKKMEVAKRLHKIQQLKEKHGNDINTQDWLIKNGYLRTDNSPDGRRYVLCDFCGTRMNRYGKTVEGVLMLCPNCKRWKTTEKVIGEWKPGPLL